jgi:hypothetical protein
MNFSTISSMSKLPEKLVISLAIIINLVVATNTILHDPYIGYDSDGH